MTGLALLDVSDGIATITLNRPHRMNAYILTMGLELSRALSWCDESDDVRAVILTGAGDAFCAGADLDPDERAFGADAIGGFLAAQDQLVPPYRVRKPVIAAINGHAVGIGLTLALQCDIRYVDEAAKLGFPFVSLGILPENSSHWILPRVIGLSRAAELLLSGTIITGADAARMGLASAAMPKEEVMSAAKALASGIVERAAPVSVALTKSLLWRGMDQTLEQSSADEITLLDWSSRQADAEEGARAFSEKRRPEWRLRVSTDAPPQSRPATS